MKTDSLKIGFTSEPNGLIIRPRVLLMGGSGIEKLFSNRVMTELLRVFMTHPDEEFHQRQLASLIGRARRPVQLNLQRLEDLGLIASRPDGNRVAYRANKLSPIFEDLKRIVLKTVGLGDLLREGLTDCIERVALAFVYGSVAEGTDDAGSDIDLLIVGDLSVRDLSKAVSRVREHMNRELSVHVYSRAEFRRKYRAGNHFIRKVTKAKKILVVGGDEEFRLLLE